MDFPVDCTFNSPWVGWHVYLVEQGISMFEYMALHLNLRAIPKGFLTRTYPCKAIRLLIQLTGKSIAGVVVWKTQPFLEFLKSMM
ncbi:PREDICTED: uncharacterized protein LOC109206325 isoform X3 [Nicotiana attenuata]|uniref:uncharacterized protein LOC109206325 isoform X3 n=1 Tax=Nicotiana attenuata TaxID=49451 RepID=UPI0009048001|nr:PREDICTED: uncharacterized protein LOC109206325 isoform X3 [Nicotiana attenuata]